MTIANKITVTRILLIPVFVTLAIYYGASVQSGTPNLSYRIAALATFALAALSDGLDGFIARHFNQATRLGRILDPIADKALMLSAILTLSFAHWPVSLPIWFAVLVIGRDTIILVGIAIIHHLNGKVHIAPHWTSKACTFFQLLCIVWIMLDFRATAPQPILLIGLAGVFTVVSGAVYVFEGIRQLKEQGHTQAEVEPE